MGRVGNSRAWTDLTVVGEPVVIPYRIYNPAPSLHFASGLSRIEQAVTAAIYSRHHDGLVRHRALVTLLDCGEPWTAPFVVQLLGEYVIQICADIEEFTRTALPRPAGRAGEPVGLPHAEPLLRRADQAACHQLLVLLLPGPARHAGHLPRAHGALKAQRQHGNLKTQEHKPASRGPMSSVR
jgi:hypothetical protein